MKKLTLLYTGLFIIFLFISLYTVKNFKSLSAETVPQVQQNQLLNNVPVNQKNKKGAVQFVKHRIKVKKYKTRNGFSVWETRIPGGRALTTPCIVNNRVFIGGGFGSYEFYSFNARNGRSMWQIKVNDDGPTTAVAKNGYVAFNTESCTLFVVKEKTGKMVWSRWLGDPLLSQPAISKNMVFMVYPGGGAHYLIAIKIKNGKTVWKKKIDSDAISAPIVSDDSVYVSTFAGTVYRFKIGNGKRIWKKNMQATSAPWIIDGKVFITKRDKKNKRSVPEEGIFSMDKKKGDSLQDRLWSKRKAEYLDNKIQRKSRYFNRQRSDDDSVGFSIAPATAKTVIAGENVGQSTVRGLWEYQGSRNVIDKDHVYNSMGNIIQLVNRKSGKVVWSEKIKGDMKKIGGHIATPPAIGGNKIVIGTSTGKVICMNRFNGKKLWELNVKSGIRFQPSLYKGRVYVGTVDGRLICVDTKDKDLDGWVMWGGGPEHNGRQ